MFFEKDDRHEFKPILAEIEESPVSPLGRSTFWIIVFIIAFTILWTCLGKVDIVISARGKIIPDGELKIIQPLETGVISKILIKEGDFVKKNEVLMEIDPSTTAPQLQSMQKNLNYTQVEMTRLKAESSGQSFNTSSRTQQDVYSASIASLEKQLSAKKMELEKINNQISSTISEKNNYKILLKTNVEKEARLRSVLDIIPKTDYEKVVTDISTYKTNIEQAEYKFEELNHQKQQTMEEMAYLRENFKSINLKDLSDKEKSATQLEAQIQEASFKNIRQRIVSPVDGYINKMLVHTLGGVVTPAEKLISIVPVNSPLVIKADVMNKDIGFIKKGMNVAVKIDTFNFQKYGMLRGKVIYISKDSIDTEKQGPIYEVRIQPIDKSLMVDGKRELISSGMSLSAEIKVGKRRIIEFFIYPIIKYLNESISVK